MKIDVSSEIYFVTSRSGGKGGQNVNKVETAVEGFWDLATSRFFTEAEKLRIHSVLAHRLNASGQLHLRSQTHRSQLSNKKEVLDRMHRLIAKALVPPKPRLKTRPTQAARKARLENKKKWGTVKKDRRRIFPE